MRRLDRIDQSSFACSHAPLLLGRRCAARWAPRVGRRALGAARWAPRAILVLLAFAVQRPPAALAQTISDSAGVRVVTYDRSDRPAGRWRIESAPLLTIGTVDGAPVTRFFNIAQALRLPDGGVAVADWGAKEIRIFDQSGAHRRTLGGAGRGPGEFPSLWQLLRRGADLVGLDGRGIGQEFSLDGRLRRTIPTQVTGASVPIELHGFSQDGTAFGSAGDVHLDATMGRSIDSVTLIRIDENRKVPIGRFPHHVAVRREGMRPTHLVFGPVLSVAVLGQSVCLGFPSRYAFACVDTDGKPRVNVSRTGGSMIPVTDAQRDIYFHGIDVANAGPRGAEYRQRVRRTTAFAESLPAYGRFVPSSDREELWIGPVLPEDATLGVLNASPPTPTIWSVFSTDGIWLSDVTLPARFRLMDAGFDFVAGVVRDDDDVERVVVFRLTRSTASAGSAENR